MLRFTLFLLLIFGLPLTPARAGLADECKVFEITDNELSANYGSRYYSIYVGRERAWVTPVWKEGWFFQTNALRKSSMEAALEKIRAEGKCGPIFRKSMNADPVVSGADFYLQCGGPGASCAERPDSLAATSTPEKPATLDVKDDDGKVLAGMAELAPGSGLFIGSRHLFEGNSENKIRAAFEAAGLNADRYRCYEFFRPGPAGADERLDVVLSVPSGSSQVHFEVDDSVIKGCEAGAEAFPLRYRLRFGKLQRRIEDDVNLGDKYYSYQYGTVGDDVTRNYSRGNIGSLNLSGRFYLPPSGEGGAENRTTLRSSGSVVFVRKLGSEDWKPGGIVECEVPPVSGKDSGRGLDIPGATRVISLKALGEAYAIPVSCTSPTLLEKQARSKSCIPVDGRGGGGP